MLNKKILAATIAATLSAGVQAVDFTSTPVGSPTIFAAELVELDSEGLVEVRGDRQADLSATFEIGFTVGEGTSKYIRIDLQGGTFTADSDTTVTVDGRTAVLSQGGSAGDTSAVFEIAVPENSGADIPADGDVVISSDEYAITNNFSMMVNTHESASDAVNGTNSLAMSQGTVAIIANGSDGEIASARLNTATVESFFERFDASTATATTATTAGPVLLGKLDFDQILLDNRGTVIPSYREDGFQARAFDFYDNQQDITVSGDFSFGTFTFSPVGTGNDNCGTQNEFEADDTSGGSITFKDIFVGNDYNFCVTAFDSLADRVKIEKGNYVVNAEEGQSDVLGVINYNSVSIEVPYITTFDEYNQRIYLVNNGSRDADYSMTFTSEGGTEATPGAAATGTIPAGEMIALRATDIVTLDGRTRTSAVIEVSATEGNVSATMQTVNLETGGTDTVVLNANSITAFEE